MLTLYIQTKFNIKVKKEINARNGEQNVFSLVNTRKVKQKQTGVVLCIKRVP